MRRKRKAVPLMLFWSRREQRQFLDGVDRLAQILASLQTWVGEVVQKLTEAQARPKKRHGGSAYGPAPDTE
jgi:hypothetical protein